MEIGVFKGEFSKFVFNEIEPSELHLVDLFEGQMCSGDKDGNNIIWTDLNQEYNKLILYFNNDKNVFLHKGFSYDILSKFDNEYFDMVYIDGDHSYECVKNDLDIAFDKVKSGGYICGHDYTMQMFEGVVRAVTSTPEASCIQISRLCRIEAGDDRDDAAATLLCPFCIATYYI
jgi:hypothetical protein